MLSLTLPPDCVGMAFGSCGEFSFAAVGLIGRAEELCPKYDKTPGTFFTSQENPGLGNTFVAEGSCLVITVKGGQPEPSGQYSTYRAEPDRFGTITKKQ